MPCRVGRMTCARHQASRSSRRSAASDGRGVSMESNPGQRPGRMHLARDQWCGIPHEREAVFAAVAGQPNSAVLSSAVRLIRAFSTKARTLRGHQNRLHLGAWSRLHRFSSEFATGGPRFVRKAASLGTVSDENPCNQHAREPIPVVLVGPFWASDFEGGLRSRSRLFGDCFFNTLCGAHRLACNHFSVLGASGVMFVDSPGGGRRVRFATSAAVVCVHAWQIRTHLGLADVDRPLRLLTLTQRVEVSSIADSVRGTHRGNAHSVGACRVRLASGRLSERG